MTGTHRVAVLVALIHISAGCNTLLGVSSHPLAHDGGDAGAVGGSPDGSDAGTESGSPGGSDSAMDRSAYAIDGEATSDSSCGAGRTASDAGDVDAATICGFTMPNPADAGLPNAASYTPNADGTITDNVTSLVWQGTVFPNNQVKRDEAIQQCEDMGSGFRLPTRLELVSLVDFTRQSPAINPGFMMTPAQRYWTSSSFACDTSSAYYVDFDRGIMHPLSPDNLYWVRCVKGGPSRCVRTRYEVIEGGKSAHDNVTGLTWQSDFGPKQSWTDAMTYCSRTLGASWRLPSLTELQTIVDENRGGTIAGQMIPPIDGDKFPNTPVAYFWTSTLLVGDAQRAGYVAFIHGHADFDLITNTNFVRCVRWDGVPTP